MASYNSINKVTLLGNLGQDPQVRTMASGQKVVQFSLATSEQWKDKMTNEKKEATEWHRVVVFQPNLVDVAERMLQKGTKLYIEGTLRTRKWQNQQGQDVWTTEIVLNMGATMIILGNAKPVEGGGNYGDYGGMPGGNSYPAQSAPVREEMSVEQIGDDIPF